MTREDHIDNIVGYWFRKADESLDAARDESAAGRLSFAVNRIYYACFYAASALLFRKGHTFKKHSGLRAAFHQHLVKPGHISREQGRLYEELFEARQRADYIELVEFEKPQVNDWLDRASGLVEAMEILDR